MRTSRSSSMPCIVAEAFTRSRHSAFYLAKALLVNKFCLCTATAAALKKHSGLLATVCH